MELVTEPVIHDAETAVAFAKELQLLLRYLELSDANMEKGEMRIEANISVSKDNNFGTKVEVKNLNSFKAVEKAITFEMGRHIELLERGEKVSQETRGWDEKAEKTFAQRTKEDSHDYRYFPDPDLPKLFISEIPEFDETSLKASLPELPSIKRERLLKVGLPLNQVEIYINDPMWSKYFEAVAALLKNETQIKLASNYITSDLKKVISEVEFAEVIKMLGSNELSSRGAKDILKIISTEGGQARSIAETNNLLQKSDTEELKRFAKEIISENSAAVAEYKSGKQSSLQFLIGQGMKASKGSANPTILKTVFEELLK